MTRFNRSICLLLAISLIALFTKNETAAQSNILVVNSKSDAITLSGCDDADCSLLDAINYSNVNSGQTIQFNIPGNAPFTIFTNNGFEISQSVIIDATTQPGYSGKPLIEIRPSNTSVIHGIYFKDVTYFDPNISVTIRGLAINGFANGAGIFLNNGQNHLIEKNFIGVDVTGTVAQPNDTGINIRSPNNIIRQNVISGNKAVGILMVSNGDRLSTNNQIVGNFIGTNYKGTEAVSNQDGIQIREGAYDNIIGGTTPSDRNIISGNTRWGIYTEGHDGVGFESVNTHSTTIQGNYIGTDASGTLDLGNGAEGILILRSDNNIIGGTTGTTPGGNCSGACNLISGNNVGIILGGDEGGTSENNSIQGNFIGTTVTGQAALPNNFEGVAIGSSANKVGGTIPEARNLISGNNTHGIRLGGPLAFGNVITGNYIGTDTSGLNGLGNHAYGIFINGAAYGNRIGDGTDDGANWIGFNGLTSDRAGIGIDDSPNNGFYADQNLITGNSIFYNTGLGIDLLPTGVMANDVGDNDTGANGLQNMPIIDSVVTRANTMVSGTLKSAPNRAYTIELFASTECDATGYGEGEFFLGGLPVTTDGSGNASFETTIAPALDVGSAITATAIDNDAWNTSEFSACKTAQADLSIIKTDSADPVLPGDSLSYTLTVSNPANASYADNVVVTDTLPVGLSFVSANASQGSCNDFDTNTRKVTCAIGQLTDNATATITIATTVNLSIAKLTISNTASVSSVTLDPVLTNNATTESTGVAHANLRVVITDTPDPVLADALLTYTVVVSNLGTDTATNVALTDTLPANVYLIGVTTTKGLCTPGSVTINCSLGTLINGGSAAITILIRPKFQTQNTTIVNTASVSALQVDPVTANNSFTATTKVNPSSGIPPLNLFTISTPTLTWNAVSWAVAYEIEVDNDSGFNSPNFENNNIPPGTLFATTTLLADGIWYWHVRAKHEDGTWGGWSATASFMIDTP